MTSFNEEMMKFGSVDPSPDKLKFLKSMCLSMKDCIQNNPCSWDATVASTLTQQCEHMELFAAQVPECLPIFFTAIRNESFSCTKEFNFLTSNQTEKRDSYTLGKTCFLEIVEKRCQPSSQRYLHKNCNEIATILVDESASLQDVENCDSIHIALNQMECLPLMLEFGNYSMSNDTESWHFLPTYMTMCRNTVDCHAKTCPSFARKLDVSCKTKELLAPQKALLLECARKSSEVECFSEITRKLIQSSDTTSTTAKCTDMEEKMNCVRLLMVEGCSAFLFEDFEDYLETLTRLMFYCQ